MKTIEDRLARLESAIRIIAPDWETCGECSRPIAEEPCGPAHEILNAALNSTEDI